MRRCKLSQEQGLFLLIAKIGLLTKKAGVLFLKQQATDGTNNIWDSTRDGSVAIFPFN